MNIMKTMKIRARRAASCALAATLLASLAGGAAAQDGNGSGNGNAGANGNGRRTLRSARGVLGLPAGVGSVVAIDGHNALLIQGGDNALFAAAPAEALTLVVVPVRHVRPGVMA